MRGKNENLAAGRTLANASDELEPRHSRHAVICDQQIEGTGFACQLGQRLLAVAHDLDFVAVGFQGERNRKRDRALVFREENVERGFDVEGSRKGLCL